jgi:tetratricopeptide (TPR) repeat protein
VADVAGDLYQAAAEGHPRSAEALEILARWCMAEFRMPEAGVLTARWVEAAPASAAAWALRAEVLERLGQKPEAAEAYRRLAELGPADRKGRLALARVILETRQDPDEAARHLEWLTSTDPADTAAQVQLGACREAQGRPDEAAAILDRVVAGSADPTALYYRGRLELNAGRPAAGLPFLRRAADLDPSNVELLYTLFVGTQRAGTANEAKAAEERWRRCEADRRRVSELARAIGASPYDPDLRREMGELFLRNGQAAQGVRWLESALRLRPDHAATHRVLAGHYERTGRPDLAREHAGFAPR